MKKKTAAMVLAALMAFSMTACGNGSTQKEDDSTAADQETTEATETADNTVADDTASGDEAVELHWLNKCESDVEAQIWQQVADLVHEKYPNITVTVENTDWTSYWTKLPVELASGNAPDLIYMHFSRASDYTNSMLPISDYIEKDEMPLGSYTLVHREAALTEAQKNILIDYFKSVRTKLNYKE